ncbi:MAG: DUF4236 domain-containing protein [Actinobacteria bacterium]|nr:DUF4236 domain-containing protein [Actinomycetota bacterium]
MSAWQLRRSESLFGGLLRITATRKGLGTSVGIRGLRFSRSPSGKRHRTVGIPGTGLFERTRIR